MNLHSWEFIWFYSEATDLNTVWSVQRMFNWSQKNYRVAALQHNFNVPLVITPIAWLFWNHFSKLTYTYTCMNAHTYACAHTRSIIKACKKRWRRTEIIINVLFDGLFLLFFFFISAVTWDDVRLLPINCCTLGFSILLSLCHNVHHCSWCGVADISN